MGFKTAYVFALIGLAVVLFIHWKIRYDIVALLVVIALMLAGTPSWSVPGTTGS